MFSNQHSIMQRTVSLLDKLAYFDFRDADNEFLSPTLLNNPNINA